MGTETSLLFRHGLTLDLSWLPDREQRRGRHFHWLAAPAIRQYMGELRLDSRIGRKFMRGEEARRWRCAAGGS